MSDIQNIFKYEIDPTLGLRVEIPKRAKFLSLQVQNDKVVMWWTVPKESSNFITRNFIIATTGYPSHIGNLFYVGTFQLGGFVGHVFSYEGFEKL